MAFYSKLEAVNTMLLESGEHIVNDLSSEQGVDTSVAQFILEQTTKQFMSRGLANNRYETTLTPSANGKIYLPSTTIYAQAVDILLHPTSGEAMTTSVKQNPARLFNLTTQSDTFNTPVKVNIIFEVLWEDIEVNMQKAIISSAARDYQRNTMGDSKIDKILAEKEMRAIARGRAADINKKGRSLFTYINPWSRGYLWRDIRTGQS